MSMLKLKLIFSACLGTAVYAVMLIFSSSDGIYAYQALETQKHEIAMHLNELTETNDELYLQYNALKQDGEVIASYARKLGYVSGNEKLLKINGLMQLPDTVYDPGYVKKTLPEMFVSEYFCKTAGILTGVLLFLLFAFFELVSKAPSSARRQRNSRAAFS